VDGDGCAGADASARRSLGRWREIVRKRLVGSAFAWLGPRLDLCWSDVADAALQLETLLDRLTGTLLTTFVM